MERIAILFDIEDLGTGDYGQKAWHVFFAALAPDHLGACFLAHGDTDERIPGRTRAYCWAIAVDCMTTQQVSYVKDVVSKSQAKGLMPVATRFAGGQIATGQPLITVARIDLQGDFVLLDDAYVWLLIAANKAGWQHKLDPGCVDSFVSNFVGRYEHGLQFGAETNLVLARTLAATSGPDAVRALESALAREQEQRVRQAYEDALTQICASCASEEAGSQSKRRWWQFWK